MSLAGDERGVSEQASVAVLVLITVLVTASVGVSVLVLSDSDEQTGTQANFTYQFSSGQGRLIITHDGGDRIPAGALLVSGPDRNVTWATLANKNGTAAVVEGDSVLLSSNSAYGTSVFAEDTIEIVHAPGDGNRTVLKSCTASC